MDIVVKKWTPFCKETIDSRILNIYEILGIFKFPIPETKHDFST